MRKSEKPFFSLVITPIFLFIEKIGIEILATDTVWSMVLGTLPTDDSIKADDGVQLQRYNRRKNKTYNPIN